MSKRTIIAVVHRKRKEVRRKYYANIITALRGSAESLVLKLQPGDVIQYLTRETEALVGEAKVRIGGRINIQYEEWFINGIRELQGDD